MILSNEFRHYSCVQRLPSILLCNARSIFPKLDELCLLNSLHRTSIIAVTESWLTDNIDSTLLSFSNHTFYRCDRNSGRGGGVCVWCNISLHPEAILFERHEKAETLVLYLRRINCVFILIYIPPGLCVEDSRLINTSIVNVVDSHLRLHPDSEIILCGDFNQHNADVIESSLCLANVVNLPTRNNNVLDKIFLSQDIRNSFNDPIILPPLSNSDHNCVLLQPSCSLIKEPAAHYPVFDLRESHVNQFVHLLSKIDFTLLYKTSGIDDKVALFYSLLYDCMQIIPRKFIPLSSRDKPWITPVLKNLIHERWTAFRVKNFPVYRHLKNKIKTEIRLAKRAWMRKSTKPRDWWNVVNEMRGTKTKCNLNSIVEKFPSLFDAVECINEKFGSSFTVRPDLHFSHGSVTDNAWIPLTDVLEVYRLLKSAPLKACGSDDVPARLYREGALFLAEPLCHIFNSCILECYMPKLWKLANISPIPKTMPPQLDALRPISLLPLPSKLLERFILEKTKSCFIRHIDKNQFAYLPQSSTTCALIHLLHRIVSLLDEDNSAGVAILSLDYSKAFDTISHPQLIKKMTDKGFPQGFVTWTASYLSERYQRTKINNVLSSAKQVTSGVPQGSIIGPYLFNLYTSDLLKNLDCFHVKYADDTTLLLKINSNELDFKAKLLQIFNDIQIVSSQNSLVLNVSKTKLLICPKHNRFFDIHIPGVERVAILNLLGVSITQDLKWDQHFRNVMKKCNRRLYALRLLKPILNDLELSRVYMCLVANVLNYAAPLFVALPMKITRKIDCFVKRCHRTIHQKDCSCGLATSFREMLIGNSKKLFFSAASSQSHPLHALIPLRLPRTGHFNIEYSKTLRKQSAFPFNIVSHINSSR